MQNKLEIYIYWSLYKKKIRGRYRSLNMGVTKCIRNLSLFGTVTEADELWSCYATIACDKMIKIIFAIIGCVRAPKLGGEI